MKTPAAICALALLTTTAPAAVIFVDIVPDYFVNDPFFGDPDYDIDFNQDGTVDIRFVVSGNSSNGFNAVPVLGTRVQSVPVGDPGQYFAYPMLPGVQVGPTPVGPASWIYDVVPGSTLSVCGSGLGICFGYFSDPFTGWVGVEFTLSDGVHYGVVGIEGGYGNGSILSYAWETTPGMPITAPEPGRMILCVAGLWVALSRRRRGGG